MSFFGRLIGRGRPVVSVLRFTGPIGMNSRFKPGVTFSSAAPQIDEAFSQSGLKAVALVINSPGGSPVQSAQILQRIRDLAREKDVPVLAFTEDVAASGGYMLALAGDEIFVNEASIIGSIGVVAAGFGFTGLMEKVGIDRRLYTAGENKARLDSFSPQKPEDVTWIENLQAQIHDYFKEIVIDRRGRRLKADAPGLFSGDVWLGRQAVALGLVDAVADMRTLLRQRFGKKVKFRTITARKGLLSGVFGGGGSQASDADAGGYANDLLAAIEARLMWNRFGL
ncbi:peptidase S49 [Iodidimonas muriae]|uniref:Peptidase S49 n=1 Tax=Iodidimonas muriae TaxID=261467 RepID=A0ABQ2LEJ3_9PROT|nr:S49 family peptidase [Iodidimonas muriae]GER07604.1 peptidase S49 [Kordiimonadales bacterium JCM 17843]GGO13765.1 peptidase S49 [Iodidimonas muriae]